MTQEIKPSVKETIAKDRTAFSASNIEVEKVKPKQQEELHDDKVVVLFKMKNNIRPSAISLSVKCVAGKEIYYEDVNGNRSRVTITAPKRVFNLNNAEEARQWDFSKDHELVNSPNSNLLINHVIKDAIKDNKASDKIFEVITKVGLMADAELIQLARVLGVRTRNVATNTSLHFDVVKKDVRLFTQTNPEKVLEIITSPEYNNLVVFHTAKEKGLITFSQNVWRFGQTVMGLTESEVINWMKTNNDVTALIIKQLKNDLILTT